MVSLLKARPCSLQSDLVVMDVIVCVLVPSFAFLPCFLSLRSIPCAVPLSVLPCRGMPDGMGTPAACHHYCFVSWRETSFARQSIGLN